MPSRKEFDAAAERLCSMGWDRGASVMADDAHKEGVTNFGTRRHRGVRTFWLNFKTINSLPL